VISGVGVGAMTRTMILVGTALTGMLLASAAAQAEPRASVAQASSGGSSTDLSAQRRLKRIPIYPREEDHWQPDVEPRYNPGPNAVRVCNAHYVQEARPSGTVIVPRMSCYWRG
jgi:hypothetical protein